MIQNVEELGAKLQAPGFMQPKLPADGKVPLPRAEPAQGISSEVSLTDGQKCIWIDWRINEGLCIKSLPARTWNLHGWAPGCIRALGYLDCLSGNEVGADISNVSVGNGILCRF